MRKLLKVLFSQTSIIIMLMLVQIAVMLLGILKVGQYVTAINFLITAIAIIIIVNSHQNPAYKLSWIIPLALFPLFGGLFYLFLKGQTFTKVFFKRLKSIDERFAAELPENKDVLEELRTLHPDRYNTANYCSRNPAVGYRVYKNTDVVYYPVGELCWTDMLSELEKAEKYIFLEYFIIERGQMWDSILEVLKRKAAMGVDVRVLYDGIGSLTQLPKGYPDKLRAMGISCKAFSPLVPFLSTLQNNRDHRKIMVIDGKTAFTGGVNLSDEYINKKDVFGHWKDTAVKLTGDGAYSFAVMFLKMWQLYEKHPININDYRPDREYTAHDGGYVLPYGDVPNDDFQVGEFVYMDIINRAKRYVHITTPYLILDHEMMTALVNAARSGVEVKLIIPSVADHWYAYYVALDYAKELILNGVSVYEYTPGFIHGKNFVSDDEVAVVGSINLDYRSLYLHFECAAWLCACPAVGEIEKDFEDTLKNSRPLTIDELNSRSAVKRFISAVLRFFAPLM